MSEPIAQPAAAPETSAPEASAPAAPAPVAAPKKGFLASLVSSPAKADLAADLAAANGTIAAKDTELETLRGELADYKANESALEAQMTAAKAASASAATAEAAIPEKVAAQTLSIVEGLGLPEATLPESEDAPPAAGTGGEFAGLKGLEKVSAAFSAQFN
jgi:hypothetical protein